MSYTMRAAVLSASLLIALSGVATFLVLDASAAETQSEQAAQAEAAASSVADSGQSDSAAPVSEGRQLFLDQNCALCHTAYARGIGEPPEDQAGDAAAGEAEVPGGPPDLSVLGGEWTGDLLTSYLVDRVPFEGEKHVTSFRGSDEQWKALRQWLLAPAAPDSAAAAPRGEGAAGDANPDAGTDGSSGGPGEGKRQ
jgi:cytochrome c5